MLRLSWPGLIYWQHVVDVVWGAVDVCLYAATDGILVCLVYSPLLDQCCERAEVNVM